MRSKTSIFATYAFLALVGAGGFMWTAKTGETLNTAEAFLAFFGFFSISCFGASEFKCMGHGSGTFISTT